MQFAQKLAAIEARFEELTRQMTDPAVINDSEQYRKTAKTQSDLNEVVGKYREWKTTKQNLEDARGMLSEPDPELLQMAQDEVTRLEPRLVEIEEELKVLLLPKDPNDEKNVVLEIRAGTGGDEATLFAAEIFRMYTRYAEDQRWRVEITSASESGIAWLVRWFVDGTFVNHDKRVLLAVPAQALRAVATALAGALKPGTPAIACANASVPHPSGPAMTSPTSRRFMATRSKARTSSGRSLRGSTAPRAST